MRNSIYLALIAACLIIWYGHKPTFKERFQPAIDHPLKAHGFARQGFCFPGTCRIAMVWDGRDYP